jgi:hypothetical protein
MIVLPILFHPFIFLLYDGTVFTLCWNLSSIAFDEEELNMIHNLVTLLEAVKLAVEALCRRDATLLSADTTISFVINNLGNSDLAVQLKESLLRRMNQRQAQVSSLLQYLHKGNQTYAEFELDPKF